LNFQKVPQNYVRNFGLDDSGKSRVHSVTPVRPGRPRFGGFSIPRDGNGAHCGLRGDCLNTGEPVFTNAPLEHSAFAGYPGWHPEIERFLSVPVLLEAAPAGQIAVANPVKEYTKRDLKSVKRLAGFLALALQRRRAQEEMQAALREKEVLLREIHHRVKNNLQVISSLLSLQAGGMTDPEALEMLKESQNRVRSMALVHEQLHRSRDLSGIGIPEYVRSLTASLISSYGIDSSEISLDLRIAEATLPIDVAVPCGLIIQELVSNSLKHAFPHGRQGEIAVRIGRAAAGWELRVADNGSGLPSGLDPGASRSLGLRLVRILAEQLNATLECSTNRGTEFTIRFEIQGTKDPENDDQTKNPRSGR